MKRIFDILFAGILLVLTMPLNLIVAAAIKLSSPGPVFFKQERIGRFGVPFKIVKFRTMRVAKSGPGITVSGDRRVTPLGRFLRKWKIDEIPQLWNILKGDMSFVGPRPEIPEYVARYQPEDMVVFRVRPGLTDPATLKYRNEEQLLAKHADPLNFYLEEILPDKLRLARQYVQRRSLFTDLRIMVSTLTHIVRYS
ncbi:MAG: sugar transferase [Calditrichaeota bacterium]|nr:MAG: sugar transferase [Calditrichota bacterium]